VGAGLRDERKRRVVTLCVRRVLPPHTIAAHDRRTFQFTNALGVLNSHCCLSRILLLDLRIFFLLHDLNTNRTNERTHAQFFQCLNNSASIRFVSDLVSVNPINSTTYFDPCDCISPIITQNSKQTPYISPLSDSVPSQLKKPQTLPALLPLVGYDEADENQKKETLNDLFM